MTDLWHPADRNEYEAFGYLCCPRALSATGELFAQVIQAYENWFRALHAHFRAARVNIADKSPTDFVRLPLTTRLALLLGLGGRRVFDHLCPALNARAPGFRYIRELPEFDRVPWLRLAIHKLILNHVSGLLGPVFVLNGRMQPVFSLHQSEIEMMDRVCLQQVNPIMEPGNTLSCYISSTPWNMFCKAGLGNSAHTSSVIALIPLRDMAPESGTLWVLPGSHRYGLRNQPQREELGHRVPLILRPGDLTLLHPLIFVSQSQSAVPGGGALWLILQYHRQGEPGGFPFLPSLQIDTNSEIEIPCQWNQIWGHALAALSGYRLRKIVAATNPVTANALGSYYHESDFDLAKWQRLTDGWWGEFMRRFSSGWRN